MPENEKDEWRCIYQQVPKDIYDRLKVQLRRVALANGIASEYFDGDSKFERVIGPKVTTWECLLILLERTQNDDVLRV